MNKCDSQIYITAQITFKLLTPDSTHQIGNFHGLPSSVDHLILPTTQDKNLGPASAFLSPTLHI